MQILLFIQQFDSIFTKRKKNGKKDIERKTCLLELRQQLERLSMEEVRKSFKKTSLNHNKIYQY